MKLPQTAILIGAALQTAAGLPSPEPLAARACTTPKLRREWSKATQAERTSYINAVKCLTTKPSKIGLDHRLYDDFVFVHATLFNQIHSVAAFLPWHRYFIQVYEKALQECGYTGNAMYWDWVTDSAAPSKAKVWDPITGFGGNGNQSSTAWGTNCVLDGPFKDLQLRYWNLDVRPHCLLRVFEPGYPEGGVIEMLGDNYSPQAMVPVNAETTYDGFRTLFENGPHGAVHQGVGGFAGDMGPQLSSPNDPMFFLHHTQVDRIWWLWQQQNPQARTFAYDGPREDGTAATLDDYLPMFGLAPDVRVREVMDVSTTSLCYVY